MTSKATVETLNSLFGDTKIDLRKYRHAQLFNKKMKLLKGDSERLLIREILKILPPCKNFLDEYYMATS
jgi:hypothetical protein